VDVGVDEPGQQRPPELGHLTTVRGGGRGRLDADDPLILDEDEGAARQDAFPVEGPGGSVTAHRLASVRRATMRAG
jgi:hypothetical protein